MPRRFETGFFIRDIIDIRIARDRERKTLVYIVLIYYENELLLVNIN